MKDTDIKLLKRVGIFFLWFLIILSLPKIVFWFCLILLIMLIILLANTSDRVFNSIKAFFYPTSTKKPISFGFLIITIFFSAVISSNKDETAKQAKLNTDISTPKINATSVKTAQLIPFTLINKTRQVKYGQYNLVQAWITAKKEYNYSLDEIKVTLKKEVENIKSSDPDSDYTSVYFFERKIDYDNGQAYTLGTVDWRPSTGWVRPENDASIQDKASYKYEYSIRNRIENERPPKSASKVFDRYYSIVTSNPEMPESRIDKIVKKEFKINDDQLRDYIVKTSVFLNSDNKTIIE